MKEGLGLNKDEEFNADYFDIAATKAAVSEV